MMIIDSGLHTAPVDSLRFSMSTTVANSEITSRVLTESERVSSFTSNLADTIQVVSEAKINDSVTVRQSGSCTYNTSLHVIR